MEPTTVILMSGGLDSFISYYFAKQRYGKEMNLRQIYFDINSPYRKKELKAIKGFNFDVEIKKVELMDGTHIVTPEQQVIPGRNFIFAALAGYYGDFVWLSALKGEIHEFLPDKSPTFFQDFNKIASYVYGPKPAVKLQFPFENMSKTDIVSWALTYGISEKELSNTVTCYHPTHKRCGECSTCVKRAVAMRLNGIWENHKKEPFKSKSAQELFRKYQQVQTSGDFSHYSSERIEETYFATRLFKEKTGEDVWPVN